MENLWFMANVDKVEDRKEGGREGHLRQPAPPAAGGWVWSPFGAGGRLGAHSWIQGVGFRGSGLVFRVQGLGFRVQGCWE